jgi:hypothetical protein
MVLLIRCLQVASNPEIDLGDDDKPYQVEIMLRTMYDDDTVGGLDIDFDDPNLPRTFLDYYTPGDKYDVPVLRQKAKDMFFREIQGEVVLQSDHEIWRSDMFNNTAKVIAMVLGPSAITFADKSIQEETLEWCALYFNELLWHRYFRKMLGKGQIFSSEFAGRLFLKKARIDHVEFGIDIDNDVYDHSSADEHITQAESESESEAEEEDDDEEGDDEEEDDDGESNDGGSTQVRGYEPGEELGS